MYQAIGNLLDTPGSMIRDTLSGRNPFDQLLDPFGSSNRTSGAELLTKMGIAGDEHPLMSALLEMGLDPTTYVGAGLAKGAIKGGLSAIGKGAKAVRGMKTAADARRVASTAMAGLKNAAKTAVKGPFSRSGMIMGHQTMLPPSGFGSAMGNLAFNATNAAYNPAIRNPVLGALMINAAQSARNERPLSPEEEAYLYQ